MVIRHSTAHTTTSVSSSVKKNFGFTQWLQQAWGEVVTRCLRYLGSCNNLSIMNIHVLWCQVCLQSRVKYTCTVVSSMPALGYLVTTQVYIPSVAGCQVYLDVEIFYAQVSTGCQPSGILGIL